ncbi:DUF6059 family protein [Streptacidiphilus cavernicola]|uniref:DUF6059 family protein n=1 Tax=Streptacidiphilus cavernicola TaxID=3342716 RepID=A0ABV6VQX5_9ACTN
MTLRTLLRLLGQAVIDFGLLWVHSPLPDEYGPEPEPEPVGPPPLHPERLVPDEPLSEFERFMEHQLTS